jgi:pyridoxal phosphate enzyme (YggS family)
MSQQIRERKAELAERLQRIHGRIERACELNNRADLPTLIVVTKNFPASDAQLLFELGERNFGENREQEARAKAEYLPDAIWHYQGQIQRKKIGHIAAWADVVHSIDDLAQATKFSQIPGDRKLLLQVNFDPNSMGRGGIGPGEVLNFLAQSPVKIAGLMCVAPLERAPLEIFLQLAQCAQAAIAAGHFEHIGKIDNKMPWLSMGMSGDFESAIAAGATHIRIGSSILGSR